MTLPCPHNARPNSLRVLFGLPLRGGNRWFALRQCAGQFRGLCAWLTYSSLPQMLSVAGWESSKHNMGMAFNRNFWNKMQGCSDTFCGYDDYNWDWSVQATISDCPAFRGSSQPGALVLGGARVYARSPSPLFSQFRRTASCC